MTPNKSDSGELHKKLAEAFHAHSEFLSCEKTADIAMPIVTSHIQAVGEEIVGNDSKKTIDSTDPLARSLAIGYNIRGDEVRQRLAQYLGKETR